MLDNIIITPHAGKAYAKRKYNNERYFLLNPSECYEEIRQRIVNCRVSDFKPEEIFRGYRGGGRRNRGRKKINGKGRIKANNAKLFQDEEFIYCVRDNVIFTIMCIPGTDKITDFLQSLKK